MKLSKLIFCFIAIFAINLGVKANSDKAPQQKTAEYMYTFASNMEVFDADAFKAELDGISAKEAKRLIKMAVQDCQLHAGEASAPVGYYILAILLPPVAVGLHTNWDAMPTLLNVGLTILGWIPGIVHAIIVLER